MKTIKLTALLSLSFVLSLCWTSCNDDDFVNSPNLNGFEEIRLYGELDLEITKGDFAVTVDGDEDDVNDYHLFVLNNRLIGRYEDSKQHKKLHVEIALPEINYLELRGRMEASLAGFLDDEARHMVIDMEGNHELTAAFDCETLVLNAFGNSTIRLKGKAVEFDVEVGGMAELHAFDFETEKCKVGMEGVSNAEVMVTDELTGEMAGKCKLTYDGDPATVDVAVEGDSEVVKK